MKMLQFLIFGKIITRITISFVIGISSCNLLQHFQNVHRGVAYELVPNSASIFLPDLNDILLYKYFKIRQKSAFLDMNSLS